MKTNRFILMLAFALLTLTCKNNKDSSTSVPAPSTAKEIIKGTLNNKTGLDGCGWVIKLFTKDKHGHEYLEPTNLDKFKLTLVEGKEVEVTYEEDNSASTCMVGTIVNLTSIKAL